MRKAIWGTDYDMHTDKCYDCPMCEDCYAPIFKHNENEYRCVSCHEQFELSADMKAWINLREGTKTERMDCFKCGGKGSIAAHFKRNPVSMEWQCAGGHCDNCGMDFIV